MVHPLGVLPLSTGPISIAQCRLVRAGVQWSSVWRSACEFVTGQGTLIRLMLRMAVCGWQGIRYADGARLASATLCRRIRHPRTEGSWRPFFCASLLPELFLAGLRVYLRFFVLVDCP